MREKQCELRSRLENQRKDLYEIDRRWRRQGVEKVVTRLRDVQRQEQKI